MNHPFGDLIVRHLRRRSGLSQAKLAAGILQNPSIIAKMRKGQRLTGVQARERVLLIVRWLNMQGVLDNVNEANALLVAAGLAPLRPTEPTEAAILQLFHRTLQVRGQLPSSGEISPRTATGNHYPLIGRQTDWAILNAAWQKAKQRAAQFVSIEGEAGIGKTRLAEELLASAKREGCVVAYARAYALSDGLAYGPMTDWLRSPGLTSFVRSLAPAWRSELARLLPELVIEDASLTPIHPMTDRSQRKKLFDALLQVFVAIQQPLVLIVDDLQWCDPETLEWIYYLLGALASNQLLVIGTVRDTELEKEHILHTIWRQLLHHDQLTRIRLEPLSEADNTYLGEAVARHNLDVAVAKQLFHDCAGNPLFVIESVRMREGAIQVYDPASRVIGLPAKVYAVIASRLSRLSPQVRALVNIAAVIGRAFSVELMLNLSGGDKVSVIKGLDELWQLRLLNETAVETLCFSHDRIRDVAYAEIGPAHRWALHQNVAECIERMYSDNIEEWTAQLATHFELAGVPERAMSYVLRAIERSQAVSALKNGLSLVAQGLRIADKLSQTEANIRQIIQLQFYRAALLQAARNWVDPEIEIAYGQVRLLSQKINDPSIHFLGQSKLRLYYSNRAEWLKAQELAEKNIRLAESIQNPVHLIDAYNGLARVCLYRGHLLSAKDWFEKALSATKSCLAIDQQEDAEEQAGIVNANLAHCLCLLGFPRRAQHVQSTSAQQLLHGGPFLRVIVLYFELILNHMLRKVDAMEQATTEMQQLAHRYEFPDYLEMSHLFEGYVMACRGHSEKGLKQLRHSVAYMESLEDRCFYVFTVSMYADACLFAKEYSRGLDACNKALTFGLHVDDQFWLPEIYRLKGELLLATGEIAHIAEANFYSGLDLSRKQDSKWLELRTSISLARLWQAQGKHAAACELLIGIYGWFSEGFEMPDLMAAATILSDQFA